MPPLNLMIKPASSLCTMRCAYCFYNDVAQSRKQASLGMMTLDVLEETVKKAFAYATGYMSFIFQGGEPTLAGLDFYRHLLTLQDKYNTHRIPVHNAIQTNGLLIDDEWADFLASHRFLVGLSLDGTKEIHDRLRKDVQGNGTYDTVVHAAQILERHGVAFNILCVVNGKAAREPKKVYDSLKSYRYLQFIPCLDSFGGEKKDFSLTEAQYTDFLCRTFELYYEDFMRGQYVSIRNFDNYVHMLLGHPPESCAMSGQCTCSPVVEADGSVYPCDFYALDEWCLGRIQTHTFGEMMTSAVARRFVSISCHVSDPCKSCRYAMLCRGGCRREREPMIQGRPSLNRFCQAYKVFFEKHLPQLKAIAQEIYMQNQKSKGGHP